MSKRKPRKRQNTSVKKRPLWVTVAVVILAAATLIALVWQAIPTTTQDESELAPLFQKEGTLIFLRDTIQQPIVEIAIEVAATGTEQEQGLMHRRDMAEKEGMLFIFEESEPRSFWMHNTYISLDILFADEDFRIVNIQTNTTPLSQVPLISNEEAMYVVEVLAGFVRKYNIRIGDKIRFSLDE